MDLVNGCVYFVHRGKTTDDGQLKVDASLVLCAHDMIYFTTDLPTVNSVFFSILSHNLGRSSGHHR